MAGNGKVKGTYAPLRPQYFPGSTSKPAGGGLLFNYVSSGGKVYDHHIQRHRRMCFWAGLSGGTRRSGSTMVYCPMKWRIAGNGRCLDRNLCHRSRRTSSAPSLSSYHVLISLCCTCFLVVRCQFGDTKFGHAFVYHERHVEPEHERGRLVSRLIFKPAMQVYRAPTTRPSPSIRPALLLAYPFTYAEWHIPYPAGTSAGLRPWPSRRPCE